MFGRICILTLAGLWWYGVSVFKIRWRHLVLTRVPSHRAFRMRSLFVRVGRLPIFGRSSQLHGVRDAFYWPEN